MTIYARLAWRNIWRNRRRTLITTLAISFAVVYAIFAQSLNRGSYEMMIDNMTRFNTGYLQLQDDRYRDEPSLDNSFFHDAANAVRVSAAHPQIDLVLPRLETFMLVAADETTRGASVTGIDLAAEERFNQLPRHLVAGRFFTPGEAAAVIGAGLSRRLNLDVGDTLALIGQGRFAMSASGLFTVTGILEHPLRAMNDQVVYLSLATAQQLLSAEDHVTALLLVPRQPRHTDAIAAALRSTFAGERIRVLTWQELMPELLDLMRFDMAGAYLMSAILYVVIGFGFFGTVLTMTMERFREFGILLSVGMQRTRLAGVIFLETLSISLIGVGCGLGGAWLVLLYFHHHPITLSGAMAEMIIEMGWEPVLPVSFAADIFYSQGIIVFCIAMLIFLYPLVKISRLDILAAARS